MADHDALVQSESRLRRAQRVARLGSWELDLTTQVMWGSDEAFRVYGLERTRDNLLPYDLAKGIPLEEYRPALDRAMDELISNGTPYEIHFQIRRHDDGAVRWVQSFAEVFCDASGKPTIITGTIQDVTELVEAERALHAALRANEERARLLLEQAADAIFLATMEGMVTEVNELACTLTGFDRDELIGRTHSSFFTPESLAKLPIQFHAIEQGETPVTERQLVRKDGELRLVEIRAKRLSDGTVQAIVRDITERRRLEEELSLRQRMDSLGTLAGGIAHDFNNILLAISGNAETLQRHIQGVDVQQEAILKRILKSCDRAAHLIRGLRTLTQPGPEDREDFDLFEVTSEVIHVLEETTERLVVKEHRVAPKLFIVHGNASALFHALMNLGINAVQAVREKGAESGGVVRFDADTYEASDRDPFGLAPGSYIHVTVSDNGVGMNDDTERHIFDPLFTTKKAGARQGQGLGLAAVYNTIVRQHEGMIRVESAEGEGATFHLFLHRGELGEERSSRRAEADAQGEKTVLVVDDDRAVLELTRHILETAGYLVMTAEDGPEAIDVFREHHRAIDIVVLDRNLTKIPGEVVLQELLKLSPETPVIACTGDENVGLDSLPGAVRMLHKPYRVSNLTDAIGEALNLEPDQT